jgi:hypothetical protein
VRRCAFRPVYEAWKCSVHEQSQFDSLIHTTRLAASALLALALAMETEREPGWEQPADGSAGEGSTGGQTEGHTPNA